MQSYLLLLCSIIVGSSGIRIPDNVTKCYRTDPDINDCILKASYDMKPYLSNGIEEMEIPPLNKVEIRDKELVHVPNDFSFSLTLSNLTFYNLTKFEVTRIEFHPNDILLTGQIKYETLPYSCDFLSEGVFRGIPTNGAGYFEGFAKSVVILFTVVGDVINKSGVEHCNIGDVRIKVGIDDICGSHSPTHEQFGWSSDLLKSYSEAIAKEIAPAFAQLFKVLVQSYLTRLCNDVAYDELFPNNLV